MKSRLFPKQVPMLKSGKEVANDEKNISQRIPVPPEHWPKYEGPGSAYFSKRRLIPGPWWTITNKERSHGMSYSMRRAKGRTTIRVTIGSLAITLEFPL